MGAIRSLRPRFSESDAAAMAKKLYGLTGPARELPSERDQNFYFRRDDGQEFTLKISNEDETRAVLDLQNKAMDHLRRTLPSSCSQVLPTISGDLIAKVPVPGDAFHYVRLVTYIPGTALGELRFHSTDLLRSIGRRFGAIDKSLAGFQHDAADRELYWDMRYAGRVVNSYIHLVEDTDERAIVNRFMKSWKTEVLPDLPKMRKSVIHNDANDYNILVDGETIAIIDFGDMVYSITLSEVAIACAYVMLNKPDPIGAAVEVVRGYHAEYPLTEQEIELLFDFICARLCMSVAVAAHHRELESDNEYLQISQNAARILLQQLGKVNRRLAHYRFRDACGLDPCPQTPAIVANLQAHAGTFASVVDADLTGSDAIVLDLGIGSLELGASDEVKDCDLFTSRLFERMRRAGAKVGIGRYNEARGVYTSNLFAAPGNQGADWRTIHIGIDLFMEAGSPLFAPLDGVVHSFRNNDSELDYGPTIILRHDDFFTLYGHLSTDSLDGLEAGRAIRKGQQFARMGKATENGGWPPHVHFEIITDMLDREGEFPGVASSEQRNVWLSLCPDPNLLLGIPSDRFPKPGRSAAETLEGRRRFLGPNLSLSYKTPLKIVRGSGVYLYDDNGRGYLDCVNNVAHVGHSHPHVVRAIRNQAAALNTNTRYLHDNIVELGQRLTSTLPDPLSVCYFVNSGSEANDLALRIARAYTNSKEVIVMAGAYHGNLGSLVDISPYKHDGPGGGGSPSYVHKVRTADGFRGPFKYDDHEAGPRYAAEIGDIVTRLKARGLGRPTLILESLLSCAGQIVLPDGYLQETYRSVREAGGVCIADEVQTGFGRVGAHFWGFELQGVVPDIVTMGKPMGNGHPIGAVVTTPEIAAAFNNGMEYFNTFGGNPVSCAAALAVLDVIENEGLQSQALRVGKYLKNRLKELHGDDVRGAGLFIGVEFPTMAVATSIVEAAKARGVLLSTDGPLHNVIKIKPPIIFTEAHCDTLIEACLV